MKPKPTIIAENVFTIKEEGITIIEKMIKDNSNQPCLPFTCPTSWATTTFITSLSNSSTRLFVRYSVLKNGNKPTGYS